MNNKSTNFDQVISRYNLYNLSKYKDPNEKNKLVGPRRINELSKTQLTELYSIADEIIKYRKSGFDADDNNQVTDDSKISILFHVTDYLKNRYLWDTTYENNLEKIKSEFILENKSSVVQFFQSRGIEPGPAIEWANSIAEVRDIMEKLSQPNQ